MLLSMTGYYNGSFVLSNGINLMISIKVLNAKYFEPSLKLSQDLFPLEVDISRLCRQNLSRGTMFSTIVTDYSNCNVTYTKPCMSIINSYYKALQEISKNIPINTEMRLSDFLKIDGAITSTTDIAIDRNEVIKHITYALEQVNINRTIEGVSILQDILTRLSLIKTHLPSLEQACLKAFEAKKNKLVQTIADLQIAEKLASELSSISVYTQVEKLDVGEEICRFKNHLEKLEEILNSPDIHKGKKLDFVILELFREINTTSAKIQDFQISNIAIEIKFELEKIREQLQNIL